MAIQVNFGIQALPDSTGFILIDSTGAYNNPANLQGYGSPNAAWSTAYYARVTIKDINGNQVGTSPQQFAFTGFDSTPSSTVFSTPKMEILASSFGETIFEDSVYDITYEVLSGLSGSLISSLEKYILFDSQFQTNMKEAELNLDTCGCTDLTTKLCLYRSLDLSAFFMVESGAYSNAQDIITQLVIDSASICTEC